MALKLRQSKLLPPPLRPGLVQRPRLIARLNQAVNAACRAIVVTAPAGFGKTTQVRQWLSSGEQSDLRSAHAKQTAWLTLDEGDNDPGRFLRYLVAALQRVAPPAVEAAQALLALPQVDIEELITTLANDLAASPDPVTLVLDDYHQIHAQAIHEALCRLVEALPPSAQLVVVSREDPPLPLARLRARGELVELRLFDLRFTVEETTTFLNACMGLDLPPAQIATLAARTEGWVAGLQLAALSLQTTDDRTAFVAAFSGTQRYILDYLVEDVLSRQPEEVQDFLLRSAILERFCAPLCDAILEAAPDAPAIAGRSAAMLAYLEHANLFLIPLDDNRIWYRYHQLFADLLRTRLAASHAGRIPDLHRCAARWLGTLDEAAAIADELTPDQAAQTAAMPIYNRPVTITEALAIIMFHAGLHHSAQVTEPARLPPLWAPAEA